MIEYYPDFSLFYPWGWWSFFLAKTPYYTYPGYPR
jgi:hypothetical protein